MGWAGTHTRVPEVPGQCLIVWMPSRPQTRLTGFLPSRLLSPHNTTRLRPAAHPHTESVEPPKESTKAWEVCPKGKRGGLPSSFHPRVSRRLLWEMVLYSWLCLLCLPKALSSILWVTTSFRVVDSYSLALEVTDGRGVSSSTLDITSAEAESQQGLGLHPYRLVL